MSDSVRPHRRQPTRLPRPWDSPGKNTGVGCHFLVQCVKVKSESEVAQSCLTLRDPMDFSLPRLLCPWGFPGKSTGMGCHCLLPEPCEVHQKKKKKLQMVHASHCRLNQSAMTGWSLSLRSEPTWLTNFNAILMTWKEGSIIQTSIHGAVSKGEEEFSVGICNG